VEYALNGISLNHRSGESACWLARDAGSVGCPGLILVEPKAGPVKPVSGAGNDGLADTTKYPTTR